MLNKLRKPLAPFINSLAYPFKYIHPNILSFFSIIVSIPGFYFYSIGKAELGSLFILGALFDTVDGAVAKMTGKVSKFGGILDATLDRIHDGLLLFFIGIGGLVSWELLFILYICSVTVSYIKSKAEAVSAETNVGSNQFSVGLGGRAERVGLLFFGSLFNQVIEIKDYNFLTIIVTTLIVLTSITVIWRGIVIYKTVS
jgi:archaetidylinositol phosphate synthase